MKYKCARIQTGDNAGKYAVWTGKRYWNETVTSCKSDAEERALIMSMQWYYDQATLAFIKLQELHDNNDDLTNELYDFGDYLC